MSSNDWVMVIFTLVMLVIVGALAVFRFVLQRPREEAEWEQAARKLGLTFDPRQLHTDGLKMRGWRSGLEVTIETDTRHYSGGSHIVTIVAVALPVPLDLMLTILRAHDRGLLRGTTSLGDPTIDGSYYLAAEQPERLVALLPPGFRQLLHERVTPLPAAMEFNAHDSGPRITFDGESERDPARLAPAIDILVEVAQRMAQAAAYVPHAPDLVDHHRAWQAFAQSHGLSLANTPLSVTGRMHGVGLCAWVGRYRMIHPPPPCRHFVKVHVYFEQPLGAGVVSQSRDAPSPAWRPVESQALALHDAAFDQAFATTAVDPGRGAAFLHAGVRQGLLHLSQAVGPVVVEDHRITVTQLRLLDDPAQAVGAIERIVNVARPWALRGVAERADRSLRAAG